MHLVLSLALLASCAYVSKEDRAARKDLDGDGFSLDEDCWDTVEGPDGSTLSGADIHPGADDAWYDGVDANCDGADDFDQDADGHQVWVDCDDVDAETSPGASERCTDGEDNDCDGLADADDVDDGDGVQDGFEETLVYLDRDGDGYGDDSDEPLLQQSCAAPPGYSLYGGDCDDLDDTINPTALEVCDGADMDEDCDGGADDADPEVATGGEDYHPDSDGDGFGDELSTVERCDPADGFTTDATDCDDDHAEVNPDAAELCDDGDVDEDCDGLADDADQMPVGPTGTTTYYSDADSDGYGDSAVRLELCDSVEGSTIDDTDCDDSDSNIHPGADEVCDSDNRDEDCNLVADNSDPDVDLSTATSWYPDADDDGFGDEDGAAVQACDDPGGMSRSRDDCDDGAALVYPGAPETCGDGVSSDCDADLADVRLDCVSTATLDAANAALSTSTKAAVAGTSLAGAGDVDGDGGVDLLVGAPGYGAGVGRVYLVSGALDPDGASLDWDALADFTSDLSVDALGTAVAGGGDVDDDGYTDMLMTAPGESSGASSGGAAWLVVGPGGWEGSIDGAADAVLLGDTSSLELGGAALLADVTGDDVADLIVGAPEYDSGTKTSAGAMYVVAGPPGSATVDASVADLVFSGDKSGDRAASSLAAPGDMDGDGVDDLAVGVPGNNDSATDAGKVWLLWGTFEIDGALSTEADYTIKGLAASDAAGAALAAGGDVTGDGYADLWVSAPGASSGAGAVYLVAGARYLTGTLTLSSAVATLSGGSGSEAGTAVAGLDLDLDGAPDVAVGAPGADAGSATDAGALYLVLGPFAGSVSLSGVDATIDGDAAGDALGAALVNAGDTDDDGHDDLLLGAPSYDYSASKTDAGAVYLYTTWY